MESKIVNSESKSSYAERPAELVSVPMQAGPDASVTLAPLPVTTTPEPYWFLDINFLKYLIPKSTISPMTGWKAAYLMCLVSTTALVAWADRHINYVDWLIQLFKHESDFLLIYTSAIDAVLLLAATAWAEYEPELKSTPVLVAPKLEQETKVEVGPSLMPDASDQLELKDVALVIPAYKCIGSIKEVLDRAMKHLSPEAIILVNNGEGELQDLKGYLVGLGEPYDRVTVVDYNKGSKTIAQYVGTVVADLKGYRAVISIDDDVLIPAKLNLQRDVAMMKGDTCAVTYGIEPIVEDQSSGWWGEFWVSMQRIEYLLSMQHKIFEQRAAGGVNFPPGAAILCRTKDLINALRKVDCSFYGEDVKIGMQILYADKRIAMSSQTVIQTKAPDSFAKLWKQRVPSWDKVFYIHFFQLVITPLFKLRKDCRNNLPFKLIQLYMLHAVVANLIRLPVMLTFANSGSYWSRFAIYLAATLLPVFVWNNIKLSQKRKDLQSPTAMVALFPLYKALSHVFAIFAFAHTLLVHWPNHKRKETIPELEAAGKLNVADMMREQGVQALDKQTKHTEEQPELRLRVAPQ